MKRIDKTVLRETYFIASVTFMFSLAMQFIFFGVGRWDYTVLLGNVLGYSAAVGNFLLMGITVQSSLEKNEDDAKTSIKVSQSLRLLMLFVVAVIGYLVPVFNIIAVVIPYLFPRIAIALRPILRKNDN